MAKVLIKGGTVLSLDRAVGNLVEADVLIDDGIISEVGSSLRARGAEVVDAADTIVMPGFVDAHRHLWQSFIRDVDSASETEIAGHYQPDDIYAATLVGLLRALEAGITTVVDWCDLPDDAAHRDAALTAHADSGVRTVFVSSRAVATRVPPTPRSHSPPPISSGQISTGSRPDGPTPAHGDSGFTPTPARRRRRAARLPSWVAAACSGRMSPCPTAPVSSTADFAAIAASSTAVALTAASDMVGGVGPPPVQQLIDRGIRPGLGVGVERLAPGDVFAQMRAVISVQHATSFDLKLAGKGGVPNLLGTREVIRYATVDGATGRRTGRRHRLVEPGQAG